MNQVNEESRVRMIFVVIVFKNELIKSNSPGVIQ